MSDVKERLNEFENNLRRRRGIRPIKRKNLWQQFRELSGEDQTLFLGCVGTLVTIALFVLGLIAVLFGGAYYLFNAAQ